MTRKGASAQRDLDLLYVDGGVRLLARLSALRRLAELLEGAARRRGGTGSTPVIAPTPPALEVQ